MVLFQPLSSGIPCWLVDIFYFLLVPCLTFPPAMQLFRFHRGFQLSRAAQRHIQLEQRQGQKRQTALSHSTGDVHDSSSVLWGQTFLTFLSCFVLLCSSPTFRTNHRPSSSTEEDWNSRMTSNTLNKVDSSLQGHENAQDEGAKQAISTTTNKVQKTRWSNLHGANDALWILQLKVLRFLKSEYGNNLLLFLLS